MTEQIFRLGERRYGCITDNQIKKIFAAGYASGKDVDTMRVVFAAFGYFKSQDVVVDDFSLLLDAAQKPIPEDSFGAAKRNAEKLYHYAKQEAAETDDARYALRQRQLADAAWLVIQIVDKHFQ